MQNFFKLQKTSNNSKARAGTIYTDNGDIPTPIFMPVGTQGTVKALTQKQLEELDAKIILGNTYHLYLRPGNEVMQHFNGLHKFMNWNRPILTDSGGFQVFSLQELRKLTKEGVRFKSHIDGSMHFFSPESVVDTQRIIGSDIMMVLDECVPFPADYDYTKNSMELSLHWAKLSREHFNQTEPFWKHNQFQFGIGQGGMYKDLRVEYIERMVEIDFDGYAIGGLSVGEPTETMYEITDICTDKMPQNKPRYLMGVGTPENILESISLGIDMFDCVMPTRNARNGQIFTTSGKYNIRNARFKFCEKPIDENLDCYASQNFSLGYLRHLTIADEILGLQLASMQNIAFYLWLVCQAREHILTDDFEKWKTDFLKKYNSEQKEE
jgi:queuine tRNA-ribosyltransferase